MSAFGGAAPFGHGPFDDDTPVYIISVVAELTGLHPQTLRQYDRVGLVSPGRASGRGRRYSRLDLHRLRRVVELTRDGVNLEGVRRILELEDELARLRRRLADADDAAAAGGVSRGATERDDVISTMSRNLPVPLDVHASRALVLWRRN